MAVNSSASEHYIICFRTSMWNEGINAHGFLHEILNMVVVVYYFRS